MSYNYQTRGLFKKIGKSLIGKPNKVNIIYWDHDLFPGFVFKFPESLLNTSESTEIEKRQSMIAFVSMVVPKKKKEAEKLLFRKKYDLNIREIKATKEWKEIIKHLAENIDEIMVRPGEACILYYKGEIVEVITEPGVYKLVGKIKHPGIEFAFISTTELRDFMYEKEGVVSKEGLVWGVPFHKGPLVQISDKEEYADIKVRFGGHGTFLVRVKDPLAFFTNFIVAGKIDSIEELDKLLRSEIEEAFARQLSTKPYEIIHNNYQFLGEAIMQDEILKMKLEEYGLELTKVTIKSIMPEPSRKEFIEEILEASLKMKQILEKERLRTMTEIEKEKIRAKTEIEKEELMNKSDLSLLRTKTEQEILKETIPKEEAISQIEEIKAKRREKTVPASEEEIKKKLELEREKTKAEIEAKTYAVKKQADAVVVQAETMKEYPDKVFEKTKEMIGTVQSSNAQGQNQNFKFCMFCGTKLPIEAKFCYNCGKEQPIT